MTGVVIKSTGSWYWVRTETHEQIQCRIRGKFRTKGIKSTNPVTVGDHVDFDMELNSNTGVITAIHAERITLLENQLIFQNKPISLRQI